MRLGSIFLMVLLLFTCENPDTKKGQNSVQEGKQRPNIVWITCEDISPTLSFYGDSTAQTPNLDRLAKESLIFDNAFAPVGVCAPSRSSIITGMYPTSIGTMHMRTGMDVQGWGKREYKSAEAYQTNDLEGHPIRQYAAVIPPDVKCFTEYLRELGYFCTNNPKTDYQFAAPVTAWDENGPKAHFKNRSKNQPFFAVFNINETHESQLWKHEDRPLTVNADGVPVPPYLPDNKATRETVARNYSNIEIMDAKVGKIIKELKDANLYDNTIIFFYSDHGGPLPRQKREIYDSGLKVPFMVKNLNGAVGRTDQLISFVDLAPTMLSLIGEKPKPYMEGYAFMGDYKAKERDFVFGSSDRFDEFSDRIRAIRNKRFLYLRNDFPELTKYKDVGYRKQIPMMPVFLGLQEQGKLDSIEQMWFETKKIEELYDVEKDPHNLNNLALDSTYTEDLIKMRHALEEFQKDRPDLGTMPESELIAAMWPQFEQPITKPVKLNYENGEVSLDCDTQGASVAYYISENPDEKLDFDSGWKLYSKPIDVKQGFYIYTMSQRIGYKESDIKRYKL